MSFASITALLQAALVLLSLAQGNPNLPQSLRDNAIQTAQQAISQATTLISGGANSTLPTVTGTNGYFVLGVASNATVGTYLTAHSGMAVYFYDGDTNGNSPYGSNPKSNCYGDCANLWPPYLVGPGDSVHQAMSGVDSSKIGTMIRTDGSGTQLTYSGMPLYFYSLDTKPGDTKGDHPDGVWHVVNPGQGDSSSTNSVTPLSASVTQGSLVVDFGIATDYAKGKDAVDFGDGTPLMSLDGWCSANNCSFHHTYPKSGTYTVKVVTAGNGCGEVGVCGPAGTTIASAVVTLTGNSTGIPATIDQNGQTLSISANPNITGVVPAGYDTAQVWIVPSAYTGATDHATLFQLTRGYVVNPGISYSGSVPNASGRFAMPLSFVLGEAPPTTGAFTLLLFGVPHGDSLGLYHDSDFVTPPTLLSTAHITLVQ